VNIHPAKREVKFHREAEVRRLVAQAVRHTLLEFHAGQAVVKNAPAGDIQPRSEREVGRVAQPMPAAEQTALPDFPAAPPHPPPTGRSAPAQALSPPPLSPASPTVARVAGGQFTPGTPPHAPAAPSTPVVRPPLPDAPVPLLKVPLRLVGVVGKLYVVLESDRGLVLLDQHAAHERILFEQMLNRLERNDHAPSQRLLLPETVELSARDAAFLREQLPALMRLGVGLSEFGERTFLLDALPPFVKAPAPRQFVLELVDELKAAGQEVNSLRLGEHTVAKTVCRHAVKANDPLAGRELESLIEDLRHCAMPYTCPHGRPTLIEMNFRELEKKFGRTQ